MDSARATAEHADKPVDLGVNPLRDHPKGRGDVQELVALTLDLFEPPRLADGQHRCAGDRIPAGHKHRAMELGQVTGHRRGRSIDLTFMYCSSVSDAGSARRRRHHSGATRRRRLLSRTGGGSSVPQAARGLNQSILSGTASEDRLAPTARSANITWSRDADEFRLARVQGERVRLGHLVAAFTVQQIRHAAGIGSASVLAPGEHCRLERPRGAAPAGCRPTYRTGDL